MNKLLMNRLSSIIVLILFIGLLVSCNDEYLYEEEIPSGLGSSIYDYLQEEGNYSNYIRLIEDLEYKEVLAKTGSKTLFVADDEAFERFYKDNPWGVKSYDEFSLAQKKLIMNFSMINNALLIEGLSTMEGPVKGQVLRRNTSLSVSDTIGFEPGNTLPSNAYWDRFRAKGIRLAKDNSAIPMVYFLEENMRAKNITADDFSILFNGRKREAGDAYIYNIKVKERDITCQNGYIHVLEEVLIPPSNMAEVIAKAPETQQFSSLLERFSGPYYSASLTEQFRLLGGTDSVFVKGYFSERSGIVPYNPILKVCMSPDENSTISSILLFDPGWNRYYSSEVTGSYQTDMGAIFSPSDEALRNYFENGSGKALIERYGNVDNIPNEVLDKLIKNHMKASFLATLPSQFATIMDDAQEIMGIKASDIDKVYITSNGAVYVTNTVYSPALYSSVMFPSSINENMKVFKWAIEQLDFDAYLLSMVNYYSFFIPTDNFTYIPPTSWANPQPEAWIIKYDNVINRVYASVHTYDPLTQTVGDSIDYINNSTTLKNHLRDMLDYHIIVGNIEDGREYYRTKGGGTIRISRDNGQLAVAGGGDISRNVTIPVTEIYDQTKETNGRGNGKTYVLNEPIQTPLQSVYSILSETPEFSEFFSLLQGYDDLWIGDAVRSVKYSIFYKDLSQAGIDLNVRFLNTYHYTLYVPTNEEVRNAIQNGLPTWDDVEATTDQEERDARAEKIIRFLRYHFQDNAIFLDKVNTSSVPYETATLNNTTETFYKLYISQGNYSLNIRTDSGGSAKVKTDNGLFNIMARDFKFDAPNPINASMIETSSYIVIHQIDKCLFFE